MNYMKIDKCSVSDGIGVRTVLWVSGCSLHCKGCHNPEAQDFNAGIPFTNETIEDILYLADQSYISGLTISGGHPLENKNLPVIYDLLTVFRNHWFVGDKSIWLYTGYTWEELQEKEKIYEDLDINGYSPLDIAKLCDVVVDGQYIDSLRDITLPFRGSSNQRIIDVQATLNNLNGEITLWDQS